MATVVVGFSVWLLFAVAGLVVSVFALRGRDTQFARALVGALVILSLLHATVSPFFGATALISGVVVVAVWVDGYRNSRRRVRRRVRRVCAALAGFTAVAVFLSGVALGLSRVQLQRGLESARAGLVQTRAGDSNRAAAEFRDAESSLARASSSVGAWWSAPGRLVPIVSQHQRALGVGIRHGGELSSAAIDAIERAPFRELVAVDGRVDLPKIIAMQEPLDGAAAVMSDARLALIEVDTPWLARPIRDRLASVGEELVAASAELDLAAEAVTVVPALLGADGPQRYIVLVTNPAESRELGGFVGAFGVIEVSNGTVRLVASGDAAELKSMVTAAQPRLADRGLYPDWFTSLAKVEEFPQNLTASPNPGVVASAAVELLPTVAGGPVDGVLLVDPYAIEAFVGMLGSIEVNLGESGGTVVLNQETTADFLLRDQYVLLADNPERKDFLVESMRESVDSLLGAELPGPERLGAIFGPLARAGRIQLVTTDAAANDLLRRIHLLGSWPEPNTKDFVAVVQSNGSGNKLDSWLERSIDHEVSFDPPSGRTRATVTVTLTSLVDESVPSYAAGRTASRTVPSQMRILLSLYSALSVEDVTIDGVAAARAKTSEFGYERTQVTVLVDPGRSVQVSYSLRGLLDPGDYEVVVANQPLARDDSYTIEVTPSEGWQVTPGGPDELSEEANARSTASRSFPLVEDTFVEFHATRR